MPKFALSPEFTRACHERWRHVHNRDMDDPKYKDDWRLQQCFNCSYYIRLEGLLGSDYGACANVASSCDHRVMLEHDGCEHHALCETYKERQRKLETEQR